MRLPGAIISPSFHAMMGVRVLGSVICDRYRIDRLLGDGAMAEVFLATDRQSGMKVAVKFLDAKYSRQPKTQRRFETEAALLNRASHPNIVRGYETGVFEGRSFVVMEYVDGLDVAAYLREYGRLSPVQALRVLHDVTLGLNYLFESGLIQAHRDIKPQNLLMNMSGTTKISDFGIAKSFDAIGTRTVDSATLGTPRYMAPEQIVASSSADIRSDLYSLGAVFWELMSGQEANPGRTAAHILHRTVGGNEPVPQLVGSDPLIMACNDILASTLAPDPRHRFQTPRELLAAVLVLVEESGAPPPIPRGWSRHRKQIAIAAAALGTLASIAVGLAASTWSGHASAASQSKKQSHTLRAKQAVSQTTTVAAPAVPKQIVPVAPPPVPETATAGNSASSVNRVPTINAGQMNQNAQH